MTRLDTLIARGEAIADKIRATIDVAHLPDLTELVAEIRAINDAIDQILGPNSEPDEPWRASLTEWSPDGYHR